jgi:hypothetical protein
VNRRALALVIAGVVLVAGVGVFVTLTRPNASRPASGSTTETRAGRAPARKTPIAPSSAARPEVSTGRSTRREPARAPEEAPPSVETAPELGTLRIDADVPNAQVFIDRQYIGTAPVTAERVTPGTHQLNVSAEGFDGIARTIDVEPGPRDLAIRFREVRLSASIAVVHKHRMGSCTGQLVATAQGLRYDTEDRDDRFNAAFGDLETFVVDYLDKNLKIKLQKGKQYNFTDPDGNADRLFVFHRDVEKVRQRLAKGDTPGTD